MLFFAHLRHYLGAPSSNCDGAHPAWLKNNYFWAEEQAAGYQQCRGSSTEAQFHQEQARLDWEARFNDWNGKIISHVISQPVSSLSKIMTKMEIPWSRMILPGRITFKRLPQKARESALSERKEQDSRSWGLKVSKHDDSCNNLDEYYTEIDIE